MDDNAALRFLNEFLGLLDDSRSLYDSDRDGYYRLSSWKTLQDQMNFVLPSIRRVAQDIEPASIVDLASETSLYSWEWDRAGTTVFQLAGSLQLRERFAAMLEPQGPKLAAAELHPWVWDAAARLWSDGYRRAAVQTAASAVDNQLQAKLDRFDISGTDLITQAFTLNGTGVKLPIRRPSAGQRGVPQRSRRRDALRSGLLPGSSQPSKS